MAVTCFHSGRLGNIFYSLSTMLAYAKKHNLSYYVPKEAIAYNHFRNGNIVSPLIIESTGDEPLNPVEYVEPNQSSGNPYYHEIPKMDNVKLIGYFQSFKYIDWCREYILETLNIPYKFEKGVTSISVRRGDCLEAPDKFPIAPTSYYHAAIEYMQERGFNFFRLYSDDILWCKNEFTTSNYPNAIFQFSELNEWDDYISMSGCENNITARSTFSLSAAWLNRNPDKIVLVPQRENWWKGQNLDLIPDYFTQIHFNDDGNTLN